jgi:hypothetical protein
MTWLTFTQDVSTQNNAVVQPSDVSNKIGRKRYAAENVSGKCEMLILAVMNNQHPDSICLDNGSPVRYRLPLAGVHILKSLGCGTIARDDADGILPHIHTSVGLKEHSATAHTSHLLAATIQFLTEMIIVEVDAPEITRPHSRSLYDVPLLTFGTA